MALQDTMAYLKRLEAVGFTRKQAEVQVEILSEGIRHSVATRSDLNEFRAATKADLAELRAEMASEFMSVRNEMSLFKSEVRAEFAAVRSEMKTEFAAIRNEILQLEHRMTIKLGGMLIVAVGALAALIKLT